MRLFSALTLVMLALTATCIAEEAKAAPAIDAVAAKSTDPKIAVVDEARLLDEYEKSLKLIGLLEEKFNEEKTVLAGLKSQMEKLKESIGSPVHSQKKKEEFMDSLRKCEIEAKIRQESTTEEINRKREMYTQQVYDDMLEAIGFYSKQKDFDLVLRKNLPRMRRDLDAQLMVLYSKKEIDITDDVLKLMNAKYKQEIAGK